MRLDLSSWALDNKKLVYFIIGVLVCGGLYCALQMSKLEDPEIRVKQALVVTTCPGASPSEMELQIADPLEKHIRSLKDVMEVTTTCYSDLCIMSVELYTTTPDDRVEQCWDMVRRKAQAAYAEFPDGASMPMVRDDIDTMFGLFFALTGDGMDYRQLSDYAEMIKREISNIDGVTRVDIYGLPRECINITLNQSRMQTLGVMPLEVLATLNGQNATVYSGYYGAGDMRLRIGVADKMRHVEDIRNIIIQGHDDDQLRLGDIAGVDVGYAQPMRNKMMYNGEPALGLCIGTKAGMDVIKIGKSVDKALERMQKSRFPAGLQCRKIFYQPECVERALGTFAINLVESILIVIVVLMIFMGIRSAMIIGISLLVTVCGSFVILYACDGAMQRVSLGAFILAMGMLVDNAIVIVDGVMVSSDSGADRRQALTSIGRRTGMPLLGATLIAILAFLPIFLSPDTAGVYVRDLFIVLAVSLLLSWVLALAHVPLMADRYLLRRGSAAGRAEERAEKKAYRLLGSLLKFSLRHRLAVLCSLGALLALSLWGYRFMKKGFFPDMDYDQLYIEYKLPEGTASERVERDLRQMESILRDSFPQTVNVTASVGGTPCRYNLVRNIATPSLSYGELIVDLESAKQVVQLADKMQAVLSAAFPEAYVKVKRYNLMYKQYPIEAEFSGPDPAVLHDLTDRTVAIMNESPLTHCVTSNWEQHVPTLTIGYNQADARRNGLSRRNVAMSMLAANEGIPVSTWFDGIHPMTLYLKVADENGDPVDNLEDVSVFGSMPNVTGLLSRNTIAMLRSGKIDKNKLVEATMQPVPVLQLSDGVELTYEDPVVVRHNGLRSQRAQCSPAPGVATEDARLDIERKIAQRIDIPEGYSLQWVGEKYASQRAMKYLFNAFPLAIILIVVILIALFRNYSKPAIILAALPCMFIGIVPVMILSGNAFTFVAIVGALGLMGMLIKNGIVMVDELDLRMESRDGGSAEERIIAGAKSRLRPVMMASLTTILGMVPLLTDSMFGSLAACIMGGLSVGSVIILVLIPVLYSYAIGKNKKDTVDE